MKRDANPQGFTGPYDPANAGRIKYNAATKQRVLQIERDLRELIELGSDRTVLILDAKLQQLYELDILCEMGHRGLERSPEELEDDE